MRRNRRIIVSFLILFIFLLFLLPPKFISSDYGNTVLAMTSFLFGILAGFFIVVTTTDYNTVKNLMASEAAGWINLYENLKTFNKPKARQFSSLVDNYEIAAFDYELFEYTLATEKEFARAIQLIRNLPQPQRATYCYEKTQDIADDLTKSRQQMTVLSTKTLSPFSWVALITLGSFLVLSLYGLRTGEFFFDILTLGVSTSVVIVLLLIRDLDLYRWNEQTYSFIIDENIFKGIERLPYYPAEYITEGRIKPIEKTYRLGTYINYPKTAKRKTTVIKQ